MAYTNTITAIVPARNCSEQVSACVTRLVHAGGATEILVVDDASTDTTAAAARTAGATVISLPEQIGPAGARNRGAERARGDILLFVDADVLIAPNSIRRVSAALTQDSGIDAVFGSYDDSPAHPAWVSQYRNLLHHFTHQASDTVVTTFWSGCGAIRCHAFRAVGGFDAKQYPAPSVEDIELGYRLTRAGYRIQLDKTLLAAHLKHWTYAGMVRTDIFARALPWTRLMIRHYPPRALNTKLSQRACVLLTLGLFPAAVACAFVPAMAVLPVSLLFVIIALNGAFFKLLLRKRGLAFALACVPLHLTYYLSAAVGYALAQCERLLPSGRSDSA